MVRFVIAIPISSSSQTTKNRLDLWKDDWPDSWQESGKGLSRQVSKLGNRIFSTAKVAHYECGDFGLSYSQGITLDHVVHVQKKNVFNQTVLIGEIHPGFEHHFQDLRRPGLASTKKRFHELFDLVLDTEDLVFSTAMISDAIHDKKPKNGMLFTSGNNKFAFDITNSLVVSAISAERIILEKANKSIFEKDFLGLEARRHLSRLNNWISIPSSDSTSLLEDFMSLRESLLLHERTAQVTRVLDQRVKAIDLSVAAFVGSLGLSSAYFGNLLSEIRKPDLTWLSASGISVAISLLVSLLTFVIVRRK